MRAEEGRDQDADGTAETGPERSCIVTRLKTSPADLIRFALAPDGSVVPDIRAKLPGRGAWVKAEAVVLAEAIRRKSFARAFKTEVSVRPDLVVLVDLLLENDALQALSLANKAGLVVAGATKIEAMARPLAALVHATDGSADGTRKIEAAVRRHMGEAFESIDRVQIFRSDQLDLALGRTNVIHAALAGGSASVGFTSRSQRLGRFRSGSSQATSAAGPHRSAEE